MQLAAKDLLIEVRPAVVADIPLLISFMRSMAEFEKLEILATEELLQESLFGQAPAAHILLAFANGQPVAYVTYFFTFATMTGKRGLWLDDVFILSKFRSKGIGKALMAYLANIAVQNNCARFEWMVLDWNTSAIDFDQHLGASLLQDWRICRLEGEAQLKLAQALE